jgi:hypothetical protein
MRNTQIRRTTAAEENIVVRTHDVSTLREQWPEWDTLNKSEKRELATRTPAEKCSVHRNTTVDGLHESLVDFLDPNQTESLSASNLAIGTGTAAPASANTSLNNEVVRFSVTDSADRGTSFFTSTFLDTSEANGFSLSEVGLITSSSGGTLLNHSLIDVISKNDETTATIDVVLSFQPN